MAGGSLGGCGQGSSTGFFEVEGSNRCSRHILHRVDLSVCPLFPWPHHPALKSTKGKSMADFKNHYSLTSRKNWEPLWGGSDSQNCIFKSTC